MAMAFGNGGKQRSVCADTSVETCGLGVLDRTVFRRSRLLCAVMAERDLLRGALDGCAADGGCCGSRPGNRCSRGEWFYFRGPSKRK
eukprot:s1629_g4.t1